MNQSGSSLGGSLLPVLVQSFGIIFIGYIIGKTKLFSPDKTRGLSDFVQYLALPALVFSSISTISFNNIEWAFIATVFVGKTIIFISVVLLTMFLTNPLNIGKAGLYAIAATQSNDFALGYPLLMSLYENSHPEFPDYIYIIAPVQLIILNIIGIFFLEMGKQKCDVSKKQKFYFFHVLKGTLSNPIVIMTLLGLVWNFAYDNKIPLLINDLIRTLSNSFAAIALFLLGITMAENVPEINNFSLTSALLVTKILILPIILQKLSIIMFKGSTYDTIKDFSSFGFLYGTMPTAPTVFVFAVQYETSVNIISSTIIFTTLLSAPLMFTSATVIELTHNGFQNAQYYLTETISFLSTLNLLCCIWLLTIFLLSKRWNSISFGATIYIVFAQFFNSIGGIMLFFKLPQNSTIFYIQYILTSGGIYTSQMFALFLSVLLFIMRWKSLCYILQTKNKVNLFVIIVCLMITTLACLLTAFIQEKNIKYRPNFQMGYSQVITTFVITSSCLTGTIACLILQHFCYSRSLNKSDNSITNQDLEKDDNYCIKRPLLSQSSQEINELGLSIDVEDLGKETNIPNELNISSNAFGIFCNSPYQCPNEQRNQCINQVMNYNYELKNEDNMLQDNHQIFKHVTFLLFLCTAMFLKTAVCFWKLIMEATNGIYVELEFMDAVFNYSQGIMCFLIFGFDNEILKPVDRRWKKVRCAFSKLFCKYKDLSPMTKNICKQFKHHHLKCKIEIGQTRIINGCEFNNTFLGSDLVDWLLEEGLAQQRCIAECYGKQLLQGNVIECLDEKDDFYDNISIYTFIKTDLNDEECCA